MDNQALTSVLHRQCTWASELDIESENYSGCGIGSLRHECDQRLANSLQRSLFDDGLERPTKKRALIAWEAGAQNRIPRQRQVAQVIPSSWRTDQRNIHAGMDWMANDARIRILNQCEHRAWGDIPAADPLNSYGNESSIVNDLHQMERIMWLLEQDIRARCSGLQFEKHQRNGSLNYAFRRIEVVVYLSVCQSGQRLSGAPTASGSITINCRQTAWFSKQIDSVANNIIWRIRGFL